MLILNLHLTELVGVGPYPRVVVTYNRARGSYDIFKYQHAVCLNNPILCNLGLYAACRACLMCHGELWPTSLSHSFSSLNIPLGLARGKLP